MVTFGVAQAQQNVVTPNTLSGFNGFFVNLGSGTLTAALGAGNVTYGGAAKPAAP